MCPTLEGYVEKVPKKFNLIFTRLKVIFGGENKWKHWLVPPFIWNMRIENLNMNILISWWTILLFHFMRLYNCTLQVFNSNAMNVPNVRVENHNTKRWMGWYGRCFLFFQLMTLWVFALVQLCNAFRWTCTMPGAWGFWKPPIHGIL